MRRGPEVQNASPESHDWSRVKDRIFQSSENRASEEGRHLGGNRASTELKWTLEALIVPVNVCSSLHTRLL